MDEQPKGVFLSVKPEILDELATLRARVAALEQDKVGYDAWRRASNATFEEMVRKKNARVAALEAENAGMRAVVEAARSLLPVLPLSVRGGQDHAAAARLHDAVAALSQAGGEASGG